MKEVVKWWLRVEVAGRRPPLRLPYETHTQMLVYVCFHVYIALRWQTKEHHWHIF